MTSRVVPGVAANDGRIAAGQRVQQARLAGIRRADDGDVDALADALAAPAVVKMPADLRPQRARFGGDVRAPDPSGRSSSAKSMSASRWARAAKQPVRQPS